jgi:hypothetical protein
VRQQTQHQVDKQQVATTAAATNKDNPAVSNEAVSNASGEWGTLMMVAGLMVME